MKKNFDNYIFDMDGTLINSCEEVMICLKKAFKKADFSVDEARFTSNVIGPPLKEIIKLCAPEINDCDADNVMGIFRNIYDFDEDDVSVMYSGVMEFLDKLKKNKKRIFLATFKPHVPTLRLIKKFNLDMFEDIYTIDKFGYHMSKDEMIKDMIKKYNLCPDKTVMIGDAAGDVIAAKKAGVTGIGVLWGYGDDKSKLIENSDIIIEDIKELEI